MRKKLSRLLVAMLSAALFSCGSEIPEALDLSGAIMLISPQLNPPMQETAGTILVEEIHKRSGISLALGSSWEADTRIALALAGDGSLFGKALPSRVGSGVPDRKKEGYRIFHKSSKAGNTLWVIGSDIRGIL